MGNPDLDAPAHVIEKLKDTIGRPRTDRYSAPRAFPVCVAPRPPIMSAGSASSSIPTRRLSPRWAPRKASPIWRRPSRRRRRDPYAKSVLSHPCLRFPDGRRRHPLRAGGAGCGLLITPWSGGPAFHPRSRLRWCCAIRPTPRRRWRAWISTRTCRLREERNDLIILSDLAYAELYFDDNPPPSVLQVPVRSMRRSSSPPCPRPSPWPLAHGLCGWK